MHRFYCANCANLRAVKSELRLQLIERTVWSAHVTDRIGDTLAFNVDVDDGTVEWTAQWVCPTCGSRSWDINRELEYDEEEDRLVIPAYDPTSPLGYKTSTTSTIRWTAPSIQRPSRE